VKRIAELEAELAELQAAGENATEEIHSSCRRFFEENIRLKTLLRYKGVDENTIETWNPGATEDTESENRDQALHVNAVLVFTNLSCSSANAIGYAATTWLYW
jgi:hypothetical protein